jgi:8-oxo-dGTP diphosphatase
MAQLAQNTTLCYLEQGDNWLMLHRIKKQHDVNHDKWIGVGGKFEACESPEECLLREVREETGLRLTRWRYRGLVTFVLDGVAEYMHLFTADAWEGTMIQGDACSEGVLEWVPKEKVPALPIWEGDKIFFELLAQGRPFFSLKLCYEGDTLVSAALDGEALALPERQG